MQFKKRVLSSSIISSVALISSIILPIVPCRIAPAVPNPIYQWTLCNLNPDAVSKTTSIKEYFGYTSSITDSYFLVLLITFMASMIFFHYAAKTKKE